MISNIQSGQSFISHVWKSGVYSIKYLYITFWYALLTFLTCKSKNKRSYAIFQVLISHIIEIYTSKHQSMHQVM